MDERMINDELKISKIVITSPFVLAMGREWMGGIVDSSERAGGRWNERNIRVGAGDFSKKESSYRQSGWIGTEEVRRDAGLEPGETFCLCVPISSTPVSRFTSTVPIHPV